MNEQRAPSGQRHWLRFWLISCVALTGVGYAAGLAAGHGSDRAAENAQADLSTYVEVETRTVEADVLETAGYGVGADTWSVLAPERSGSGRTVITATSYTAGEQVAPGTVLVEVSGRPLIALASDIPSYRDLGLGDEGTDVRSLQQMLHDLGLLRGEVDGIYGERTAGAVGQLYRLLGYEPPTRQEPDTQAQAPTTAPDAGAADGTQTTASESQPRHLPMMPMEELLAIGSAPCQVHEVRAVGTDLSAADDRTAVVLERGAAIATARVATSDVDAWAIGTTVTVSIVGDASEEWAGAVTSVSGFAAETDDQHAFPGHDITVAFSGDVPSDRLAGRSVRIGVGDEPAPVEGLAVPTTAVRSDDGGFFVQIRAEVDESSSESRPDKRVDVEVLAESDGWVIVRSDDLSIGSAVRVGL
jgi:peptidoglycan hydrolase-like protein with peptidoglycan-binding domain